MAESKDTKNDFIKSRKMYIKAENSWKYINLGLLTKWEVERVPNLVDVRLMINDVVVKASSKTDTHVIFDFAVLRNKWFELLGNTSEECRLIALEDACMYAQLKAIEHYTKTPKEILRGSIFADGQELTIYIVPLWKSRVDKVPNKLAMDEYYVVSDVHKDTYKD